MRRSTERSLSPISGWWGLIGSLGLASVGAYAAWVAAGAHSAPMMAAGLLTLVVGLLGLQGSMLVQPSHPVVLVLFGRYRGTVPRDGFRWVHPLSVGHHLSLRARNMASDTIKANDLIGNPVEIGVVTVWEVRDTAHATFDVDRWRAPGSRPGSPPRCSGAWAGELGEDADRHFGEHVSCDAWPNARRCLALDRSPYPTCVGAHRRSNPSEAP